jgi:hypothetical protein
MKSNIWLQATRKNGAVSVYSFGFGGPFFGRLSLGVRLCERSEPQSEPFVGSRGG